MDGFVPERPPAPAPAPPFSINALTRGANGAKFIVSHGQHNAITNRVEHFNHIHPKKRGLFVYPNSLFIICQQDDDSPPSLIPVNTDQALAVHSALGAALGFKTKALSADPEKKVSDADLTSFYKKNGISKAYVAACVRDMAAESILVAKGESQIYKK